MPGNHQPSHRAYVVRDRDDDDAFWTPIGAAFPHRDGKGMNIVLDALPVDGRLVLRELGDEPDQEETTSKTTPARSGRTKRTAKKA